MKGLLIKDLRFMLQNKKILVSVLFIIMVFLMMGEERATFLIAYVTMMCGMLVLNTISTDEFDKSITFLMTMPIDRTIYAKEKYVFAFLSSLFGWLITTIPCVVLSWNQAKELLVVAAAIFAVLYFLQMVMLPIQLKFGSDKGRMVLFGIVALVVIFSMAAKKMGDSVYAEQAKNLLYQMINWVSSLNGWVIGAAVALLYVICFAVSFIVSVGIMNRKEF